MSEPKKCPTCHSAISLDSSTPTGPHAREQGSLGTDSNGNPIPRWSDDPLYSKNGFSGEDYQGENRVRKIHIEELQLDRIGLEAELGINPITEFSFLEDHGFHVRKTHLIELRESTEKILDAIGSSLADYFSLDSDGNPVTPGPNDTAKTDWTDVQRGLLYLDKDAKEQKDFILPSGTVRLAPTFPPNTHIRVIHIEDLRHLMALGWREFWSVSSTQKVTMPLDYSATRVQTNVFDNPGSVPNYPGITYGSTELDEFYITPHPKPIKTQTYDDPGNPLHHIKIIENATDAGQYGFPTGLDIHTNDGGNKFIYQKDTSDDIEPAYGTKYVDPDTGEIKYILDRVWIVEGYCRSQIVDYVTKFYESGGTYCPYNHFVQITYGGKPTSDTSFEIVDGADPLVLSANPKAKTLKISVNADSSSYVTGPVTNWIPGHAWGWGKIDQLWEYGNHGYDPISRGIIYPDGSSVSLSIGTKAKFSVNFRKDTCFKFFAGIDYGEAGGKSNPSTITHKAQWATQYMYDIRNYMTGGGGEEAGVDPNVYSAGDNPGDIVPISYGYASLSLVGMVGGQSFVVRVIFDKPPDNYPADATIMGQGQYDGQTYMFAAPWGAHTAQPALIAIFLGEGNVKKGVYDYALCLEDIFYAWSQIYSTNFYYISHKKKNDAGEVVENAAGSVIELVNGYFFSSAYAIPGFTAGNIQHLGYPGCGIIINPATTDDTTIAISLQVSALRIQNNTKTLQEP